MADELISKGLWQPLPMPEWHYEEAPRTSEENIEAAMRYIRKKCLGEEDDDRHDVRGG